MPTTAPAWTAPPVEQIRERLDAMPGGFDVPERARAIKAALGWVLYGGGGPISGVKTEPSETAALIEHDAALTVMAHRRAPTPAEWVALGMPHPPRVAAGDTLDWARGVAEALSWLLGERGATPPAAQ